MTLIAAVRKNNEVWAVADRLVYWGGFTRTDLTNFSKFSRFQNALIGSAGRSLFGNALDYLAKTNKKWFETPFENSEDVLDFFYAFQEFIHENYGLGASEENDVSKMGDAEFVVLTRESIFEISSCKDVSQFDNYTAIGCGKDLAIGALHALMPMIESPTELLERAYNTCAHHESGVGGPMELINVTRELGRKPAVQPKRSLAKVTKSKASSARAGVKGKAKK